MTKCRGQEKDREHAERDRGPGPLGRDVEVFDFQRLDDFRIDTPCDQATFETWRASRARASRRRREASREAPRVGSDTT